MPPRAVPPHRGVKDKVHMEKKDLLFYDEYEAFYAMAGGSEAFRSFCKDAFGADFSQDGFSNVEQVDRILRYVPEEKDVHILDIGCGNGKMLGYLQKKTGAFIHGFDYSGEAIRTARALYPARADFRVGVIGETEYPSGSFDVVISMDTMYFAGDMAAFVAQIKRWLKPGGVFFAGYQEGDVMPKTQDVHTTVLAQTLVKNGMTFHAEDITEQTYHLLKAKRQAALAHRKDFEAEGCREWFDMLIGQTERAQGSPEQFRQSMARYLFAARKLTEK